MIINQFTMHTVGGVPASVHIGTDELAVSHSGVAVYTQSLSNCVGVVVHNPARRTGCLGHMSPPGSSDSATECALASAFLDYCIRVQLGISRDDDNARRQLEVYITGGRGRGADFETGWAAALTSEKIPNTNWYEGLNLVPAARGQLNGALGVHHGAQPGGTMVAYEPHSGQVWVSSDLPLVAQRPEQTTGEAVKHMMYAAKQVNSPVLQAGWIKYLFG
ncbi:hypothetical protein [Dactylosporangium sp. CA-139066]|uniref:hypothetical protein n=1 Tax=Dactylosporangium sp. CA-139066 TaxID=3239930 RepID=UPI003D8E5030